MRRLEGDEKRARSEQIERRIARGRRDDLAGTERYTGLAVPTTT